MGVVPIKLITASYFQEENWGAGKKIGISPGKPKNIQCDLQYPALSPGDLYFDYMREKKGEEPSAAKTAGEKFVVGYVKQLDEFVQAVKQEAEKTNKSAFEIVGLTEGDTLLSWENEGHLTFRAHAADALRQLGYDVEER